MSLLSLKRKIKIPADWRIEPIGKVLVSSQYGTSNGNSETGVPVIGMKNLQDGKVNFNDLSFVSLGDAEKKKLLLHNGDILLNRTNSYDLVGKIGFVENACEAVFASYLVRLEVDKTNFHPQFVAMWLSSFWADQMIKKIATRAISQANVNPTEFKKFCLIPVLPLPEQKAIADLLSTWDEAIEKTERLIQAKEKRFKFLLRELTQEPRKDRKWKKVKLGEVGEIKKGKGITKADLVNEGVPCIRYAEVYTKYNFSTVNIDSSVSAKTFKTALELNFGDVIFAASGETQKDIGKCVAYLSTEIACTGGDTLVFRPNLKTCNALYLGFAFNTAKINKQKSALCHGNSVVHLYGKDLFKIEFHLPTLEEQEQIADTLSTAQQEINLLKQIAKKYKTQKRGLMQKVLTGEWRIKPEVVKRYA